MLNCRTVNRVICSHIRIHIVSRSMGFETADLSIDFAYEQSRIQLCVL